MDLAAASGSNVMDPNELAQSVLGQALSGDLSGFDGITVGQREVLRQMKAIVPPAACAEHHRLSIHTMEKAIDVMEAMSSSLQTQDLTQMLMLSTRAQSLMDDAEKVDALGRIVRSIRPLRGNGVRPGGVVDGGIVMKRWCLIGLIGCQSPLAAPEDLDGLTSHLFSNFEADDEILQVSVDNLSIRLSELDLSTDLEERSFSLTSLTATDLAGLDHPDRDPSDSPLWVGL